VASRRRRWSDTPATSGLIGEMDGSEQVCRRWFSGRSHFGQTPEGNIGEDDGTARTGE